CADQVLLARHGDGPPFTIAAVCDRRFSPHHFQRELNLTRWRGSRIQHSRVRDGPARCVEQVQVVQRRKKIRMIERVKKFSSPLRAEGLGDSSTGKFLATEKSAFTSPGPLRTLRPELPSRVAGAGNAKHSVLM